MEQRLQPLLGVVVAQLLESGAALQLGHSRVLETGGVHDEQGAEGVLTGLQSSGEENKQVNAKGRPNYESRECHCYDLSTN